MIVATAPFIAGHRTVETKGQTFGLVVRSRGFSGNLIAGLRSLGGGEIHEYTQLLEDTRRHDARAHPRGPRRGHAGARVAGRTSHRLHRA